MSKRVFTACIKHASATSIEKNFPISGSDTWNGTLVTFSFVQIKKKLMKEATKAGRIPTTEAIYSLLIERARANMHLVLCMSPIGDAFRNRLRQYPALINCTTIDWFLEWPREALLEVGNKFLMNLNLTLTITGENKVVWSSARPPPPSLTPFQTIDSIRFRFPTIETRRTERERERERTSLSISWNPIIFLSTRKRRRRADDTPPRLPRFRSSERFRPEQTLNIFEFVSCTRKIELAKGIDLSILLFLPYFLRFPSNESSYRPIGNPLSLQRLIMQRILI